MATLNWIGKEAVVNHDKEVPFKLLEKDHKASVGKESKNLIIHGDNLEALKALMPFYKGKVKCVYIDPPYNTGNEGWIYNDKVNSPKIQDWLSKTVKIDDLTRHDKWLCMMYPRLKLLRDLMSEEGVIFISIDDNEYCNLKFLMNEIFKEENYIGSFIWRKKEGGGQADANFVREHEYITTYRKSPDFQWKDEMVLDNDSKYNKTDSKGKYTLVKLAKWGNTARKEDRPSMHFPVRAPDNSEVLPIAPDGSDGRWRVGKIRMQELIDSNMLEFQRKNDKWQVYEKIYFDEDKNKIVKARSIIYDLANTADASTELTEIFGIKDKFDTPKPVELIKFLIKHCGDKESIVLDSFAGSGTTAQAVFELNKEDGGNRQVILVEMEDKIAKNVTAKRVKKSISMFGFKNGFDYCELEKPLFTAKGQINEACSYNELASYIYFTETQTNIDKQVIKEPFIGESKDTAYYLIYKGKNKNDLTRTFVSKLKLNKLAVIYADRCLVDEDELKEKGIIFKQIPYEIIVY